MRAGMARRCNLLAAALPTCGAFSESAPSASPHLPALCRTRLQQSNLTKLGLAGLLRLLAACGKEPSGQSFNSNQFKGTIRIDHPRYGDLDREHTLARTGRYCDRDASRQNEVGCARAS